MLKLPGPVILGGAKLPKNEPMMPAESNSDKGGPILGRLTEDHDGEKHEEGGQSNQRSRASSASAPAAHHDPVRGNQRANQAGAKAEPGEDVEHAPLLPRAGRVVANAQTVLALCTLGTLIVTGFQLHSMNGQWAVMNDQLDQMKRANDKTDEAIRAATRQAIAAENSNKIASEALSASDRAWIYARVAPSGPPTEGKDFSAALRISNGGKTPALDQHLTYYIGSKIWKDGPEEAKVRYEDAGRIVLPDNYYDAMLTLSGNDIDKQTAERIDSGINRLYVSGIITYDDINKRAHKTTFCYLYAPRQALFVDCNIKGANQVD